MYSTLKCSSKARIAKYFEVCKIYVIPVHVCRMSRQKNDERHFFREKSSPEMRNIALVRATNRCIRGSRTPASNMSNRFRWEGGAGLGLLKSDN